jgi:putative transposase
LATVIIRSHPFASRHSQTFANTSFVGLLDVACVPASPAQPSLGHLLFGAVLAEPRCRVPDRALSLQEQMAVLNLLNSDRFADLSPPEAFATLLDEGQYYCSIRTMYRLLHKCAAVRERRNQLRHPFYSRPELLATRPNEVWSWDITKLKAPVKGTSYYLYVILDVFSRYVVGWTLAHCEAAEIAEELINQTYLKQGIDPKTLTLHSDRGPSMASGVVADLLTTLGVTKSHSRPHVSNDNPYSETQFKTLKYRPAFPARFEGFAHAHEFCQRFFAWYNQEHHHSGIALLTPEVVHYGLAEQAISARQAILSTAYTAHPRRFVRKPPQAPALPEAVWINKPAAAALDGTQAPPNTA